MQRLLTSCTGEDWPSTAVRFGYHDGSHMLNAVRDLAGASPARLLDGPPLQDGPGPTNT